MPKKESLNWTDWQGTKPVEVSPTFCILVQPGFFFYLENMDPKPILKVKLWRNWNFNPMMVRKKTLLALSTPQFSEEFHNLSENFYLQVRPGAEAHA